jgi:integrase
VLIRLPKIDQHVFHGPRGGRLKADTVRRVLVRDVLKPLAAKFPLNSGGQSFVDGRLHSFRHYFVSVCATSGVPERVVMEWVGHADSAMVRHYFHLHDEQGRRQMHGLDLLGGGA